MKSRIRYALPEDFDDRHGVLIQIAHLPDETNSAPRINRGEARSIIRASRLVAHLAFLLWKTVWDRYFWIIDGDVFIRLAGDDLFVDAQTVERDLYRYLEKFEDWRAATLLSNLSTTDDAEALRNANEVIEKAAETTAPSGQSLADTFSAWVHRFARVSAFSLQIPLGVAGARVIHMPSSSRILPTLKPRGAHGILSEVRCAKIKAVAEAIRLRSADGSDYLSFRDGADAEGLRGRLIYFDRRPGSMIKPWIRAS
jgi:hypothetical protein